MGRLLLLQELSRPYQGHTVILVEVIRGDSTRHFRAHAQAHWFRKWRGVPRFHHPRHQFGRLPDDVRTLEESGGVEVPGDVEVWVEGALWDRTGEVILGAETNNC